MGIIVICLIITLIAWAVAVGAWLNARAHQKHVLDAEAKASANPQQYRVNPDALARGQSQADTLSTIAKLAAGAGLIIPAAVLVVASFTIVGSTRVGVVTTFGKVQPETLAEGPHFVLPVSSVHEVFTGLDTATANKMSAASKDMQAVGGSVTVNYAVDPAKARDLYILNPTLQYRQSFVEPALFETFKAVTSRYTAEELITKRAAVSAEFIEALKIKLAQFHVRVQNVNITDFGFSKAFDEAIEAKVTATQRAETAKNDLERIKFEAQQTIERAKAGAETIRIQAEAINKQGGQAYVDMKAVEKWDGKLPQYMMGGNNATPFIQIK
jgi:regulator of protease activity HflC (stomatin/prohibitin superfamily)